MPVATEPKTDVNAPAPRAAGWTNVGNIKGPPGGGGGTPPPPSPYVGQWNWTTVLTNPGTGRVGINTTSFASATAVNINETTADPSGARNMAAAFKSVWVQNNQILIQQASDMTVFARYTITGAPVDHGTWWSFPVGIIESGGGFTGSLPADNTPLVVSAAVQAPTPTPPSIDSVNNILKGNGTGAAVDSGIAVASVVQKNTALPTPQTLNDVIACLQSAGLCA